MSDPASASGRLGGLEGARFAFGEDAAEVAGVAAASVVLLAALFFAGGVELRAAGFGAGAGDASGAVAAALGVTAAFRAVVLRTVVRRGFVTGSALSAFTVSALRWVALRGAGLRGLAFLAVVADFGLGDVLRWLGFALGASGVGAAPSGAAAICGARPARTTCPLSIMACVSRNCSSGACTARVAHARRYFI
ncbi:hypothetical protein PXK01_04960 [Phaeobacter sp. PT47_59]|uniref:hypothetical protein n=1 Tax=Phaeobacter sp. PT47_59 TaxID=3029979 RepID=UPI00238004CD|nr:hypothetical protein [Phaeobacter sp. PT47_59]MDE4173494.1 hypothetical protein [Phaeobacter sp. PT47_59]